MARIAAIILAVGMLIALDAHALVSAGSYEQARQNPTGGPQVNTHAPASSPPVEQANPPDLNLQIDGTTVCRKQRDTLKAKLDACVAERVRLANPGPPGSSAPKTYYCVGDVSRSSAGTGFDCSSFGYRCNTNTGRCFHRCETLSVCNQAGGYVCGSDSRCKRPCPGGKDGYCPPPTMSTDY